MRGEEFISNNSIKDYLASRDAVIKSLESVVASHSSQLNTFKRAMDKMEARIGATEVTAEETRASRSLYQSPFTREGDWWIADSNMFQYPKGIVIGEINRKCVYGAAVLSVDSGLNPVDSNLNAQYGANCPSGNGAVTFGTYNNAEGNGSSVTGGRRNTAEGEYSSVLGGSYNRARGNHTSILAGHANTADGEFSSVSTGLQNKASGQHSSVLGGYLNLAEGTQTTVSGGRYNIYLVIIFI